MFYNSKKLIDEKVLQQYYFERLMLANAKQIKKLIPEEYHDQYPSLRSIKGLQPEVKIGSADDRSHVTDFVLYPTDSSKSQKLNIEIKWLKHDFELQKWRFQYYNGILEKGFVVCFEQKKDNEPYIKADETGAPIPVVYLDIEDFRKWFSINAHNVVSQALSNKLGMPPDRLTGKKFWCITVGDHAIEHYMSIGREKFVWAFRDNRSPQNIMNMLQGDYVLFVKFSHCNPGRMVYPLFKEDHKIKKSRGGTINSNNISWQIGLSDIYMIKAGYHINYSSKELYKGFEKGNWNGEAVNKDYTQFITLYDNRNAEDDYQYRWSEKSGQTIDRNLFRCDNQCLCEIVSAFRQSMNTQGDAIEISLSAFESYLRILRAL